MIVVDVQALQSPAYGRRGVGRHVAELVATLEREHPGVVGCYVANPRLPMGEPLAALAEQARLGDRLQPASALCGCDVDVLHLPAPFAALDRAPGELVDQLDTLVPVRARRLAVTLHDLIPWRFPERYLADPASRARYHHRISILQAADLVLAVSNSAAADAVELVGVSPDRITVVGAGASAIFEPAPIDRQAQLEVVQDHLPAIEAGFVLVAAASDWRKNLDGALAGYAGLPADLRAAHQLVVAGDLDEQFAAQVNHDAARLGITGRVVMTGFVDDQLLVDLYGTAELVVVPSRYEGFGLPVLEARACGAPVVCSNTSSLPEVMPVAEGRFDPDDVASITDVLTRALSDPALGVALRAAPTTHTWSRAAEITVGAYRRLAATAGPTRRSETIAIVSVIPPVPSGVADHTARLVAGLAEIADELGVNVEVFTPTSTWPIAGAGSVPVQRLAGLPLAWESGRIAHVVYCLGNDRIHRPTYDMARRVPGHVLLHDVRLTWMYGPDVAFAADDTYGVRPVTSVARSVLVQSEHAVELVRTATGIEAVNIGPLACWSTGTADPIVDDGPPWVVSAGIAHESKATGEFVAAVRLLQQRMPVRAAIVGDGGQRFVTDDDEIVTTGRVSDAEFHEWLRRADVLVQLRVTSNGESSGVAAQAIACGVPLVVSDLGAMAELPDAVAVRIAPDNDPTTLADTVAGLLGDPERRARMRSAALAFAAQNTPSDHARRLVGVLASAACEDGPMRARGSTWTSNP